MTENTNTEPGRPLWAAGLDLSPERKRPTDALLAGRVRDFPDMQGTLRRLADAEMRVAELEQEIRERAEMFGLIPHLIEVPQRGEPDFLIDADGECWHRHASNRYRFKSGTSCTREHIEQFEGPVVEAWK